MSPIRSSDFLIKYHYSISSIMQNLSAKQGHMLRFYGIRAEVLLKLTEEYKPEILHEMKHWKTTQRAARWTDGNFCYLCPVRSVSPENILNMLLLT